MARIYFPEAYNARNFAQGAPTEIVNAEGHHLHLNRDKTRNLEELISPNGHTIRFRYDGDRISEALDDAGHLRKYFYDQFERMVSVADGLASSIDSNISLLRAKRSMIHGS
jgi:uncharacterized protein RhaS with RHS repeats